MAAADDRTGGGARVLWRRLLGVRAGRRRAGTVDLRIDARSDGVRAALERLQRAVDEVARDVVPTPSRCGVLTWGDPCADPAGVRIRTGCRADVVTRCTAALYACQAHRGSAAALVALKGRCVLHGAPVDVIGVEVL